MKEKKAGLDSFRPAKGIQPRIVIFQFPDTIRRPWVGATDVSIDSVSTVTVDLSKVGRGGLAGALSAMDGAKRGPQDAAPAVPRQPTPPYLQAAPQLLPLQLTLPLLLQVPGCKPGKPTYPLGFAGFNRLPKNTALTSNRSVPCQYFRCAGSSANNTTLPCPCGDTSNHAEPFTRARLRSDR